jgi:serine/threonine-protein kinase
MIVAKQRTQNMPEKLGRYEILEEIGQGGFAVVYRAHDKQLDRLVALKELRPMLLNDPDSVKDFRREARNIARLDHPHVVTIYDVYEAEQRLFIVMQLVDGSSLAGLIATKGRLSWSETVETITALVPGLDYAHNRNILHRDLKPANILLDSNHGPMLSDFGLAKLIGEAGTSVTAGGGVVGTPHYIAPEVWEGRGTTRQSDIYALGCILYEMLIGEKLFSGERPNLSKANGKLPNLGLPGQKQYRYPRQS